MQFTKAADAGNRAVMADTDEGSAAFVREAEHAQLAVQRDADALKPILQGLRYTEETRLLDALAPSDAAKNTWRVKALAAAAVAMVREIQVLQAAHIADADDEGFREGALHRHRPALHPRRVRRPEFVRRAGTRQST